MLTIIHTRWLTLSIKAGWVCWCRNLYLCNEEGLLTFQIGPIVCEIIHGR
jgi:hypothetical protein